MTAQTYAPWPFRSFAARSLEENERWWTACYLQSEASRILAGWLHWRIIAGGPGSGKSVVLAEVEQREATRSLIVHYPIGRWPGGKLVFSEGANHLAQMMACAAITLRDYLSNNPQQIERLSSAQHTFMRWLLDRFVDSRAFSRWIDGLSPEMSERLRSVDYQEVYKTTTAQRDVRGQIDELAQLARRLGYQRVLITCDLNTREVHAQKDNLKQLFSNLELMHDAGLSLIAALPDEVIKQADLSQRASDRINVIFLDWTIEQVRDLATRHMRAALQDTQIRFEDYMTWQLLKPLEDRLQSEFGGIVPQGWVMLAETLLYLTTRYDQPLSPRLGLRDLGEIIQVLFSRHVQLELGKNGVWRGSKFIPLDPKPFEFAQILWAKAGEPIHADDPDLHDLAPDSNYVPTLAKRVRKAIEPEGSPTPIYLRNKRGEGGYWLENVVFPQD
jgi:hypothetical protein